MTAAFRLPWKEGIAKLRKQAEWLRPHHPDAAASLEEGLEKLFTINRLELSSALPTLPGNDQHHRQFALGNPDTHPPREPMEGWPDGATMGRFAAAGTDHMVLSS